MRCAARLAPIVVLAIALQSCGGGGAGSTASPGAATSKVTGATTPDSVPGAPTAVTATGGDASAVVSWTAPGNGGSAITRYTVTASPGGATASVGGGTTSATVSGLVNGTSYTFTVYATNAIGNGPSSAPSAAVTPAPATVSATVTWSAPTLNTDGSALTDLSGFRIYYGTSASSLTQSVDVAGSTATSQLITGLTSGATYYFDVIALTSASTQSAPSNEVSAP